MKTTINKTGILVTPTMAKYKAIIESGKITENELTALNSFYNKSSDNKTFIDALMYNEQDKDELTLTEDQNKKGYEFLMKLRFTPTGKERSNSPYGYREENILDNFSHFTFCGFYSERGNYYIRMYNCYSKDGNSFQYYYNGKMNIIV
jgi:hypothetical protein